MKAGGRQRMAVKLLIDVFRPTQNLNGMFYDTVEWASNFSEKYIKINN